MSNTSTIHVPLDATVRKQLTVKAKMLGFDSSQAYLRVIIKAAVDGRRINLDLDDWGEPSAEAVARLNKATVEAITDSDEGRLPSFTDAKSMMDYLDHEAH